jgi:hypothetical protein
MRRYQPFIWAVVRAETLALAIEAAASTQGAVFKELAVVSRSAQG